MPNYSYTEPTFIKIFIYIHEILMSADLFNTEGKHLYSLEGFP